MRISYQPIQPQKGAAKVLRTLKRDFGYYLMLLPGLIYFVVFKYGPMWGVSIAFMDYNPFTGIMGSKWVGLKHFISFVQGEHFLQLFRNTLLLALYNLVFYFPAPILIALLLNELSCNGFKRVVQTLIYIPHFISWVVVVGLCYVMFTTEGGIVNEILVRLGFEKVNWLWSESAFRGFYTGQVIWKECGWGTIIFLAALAAVDMEMYEASYIDGANRFERIWYITLPSIKNTVVTMLILRMGNFLNTGFEHIYLMTNPLNRDVAQVFDTYVYERGMINGSYSFSAAVGLFKSVIGLVLVLGTNWLAKKSGEEGIY